jgi:hypothetical protein
MKRAIVFTVIASILSPSLALAKVDAKKAAYFGGSVGIFAGAKEPIQGRLDTTDPGHLILTAEKAPFDGHQLKIAYEKIEDLEYGQKAGRRVGAAVGYTVLLGPLGLLTLFSKKRNHYLTIAYKDEKGESQVAVLELGKDIVRATLPIVKTKSGKEITYQDEEARKAAGGAKS